MRQVPPVAGFEEPDPAFPLPLPVGRPVACDARFGLSLTLAGAPVVISDAGSGESVAIGDPALYHVNVLG